MAYRQPMATTLPRKQQPTPEQASFVRRRIQGFLHNAGSYTLEHLLSEAYRQGLADAVYAMSAREPEEQ